jgi:hypothetical protein
MPEGIELLKQAGQSINTLVAIYSFIDREFREQYKKNLIIINRHWESANSDHKNTAYTPLYEGEGEGIKVSIRYLNSIIENHISAAGSLEYQLFRGRLVAARNTLIKFAKQRIENTIFFKESKKVDEISFAINFIVTELEKCVGYDGGTDFHPQQSHLNIIKDFIKKFLSDKEIKIQYIAKFTTNDDDNAKASVSTDFSEKIEKALNHLKQMNQNRTSSEKFRGIAARSCRIAEKTLHLIIGILQPMNTLILGHPSDLITLMDSKDLQHGKIVTTVGGGKLKLIHENIFINEIKWLAASSVDPLSSKVIHLSTEAIQAKISISIIRQLKKEYDTNATCPLILYKKVLHKNEASVHILANVHELKKEYKTIILFSNKTLPKELDPHSIYIVKKHVKIEKGTMDEILIYYTKDDKQTQEQKVDISSDTWSSISKSLTFPKEPDGVIEIKETKKIDEVVKQFQLDASIEQRLYQVGMMINLSGALLQLNRFAHLVARHASFRGDVAVYSEKSNDIIFKALNALGNKINEFYQAVEPLLSHIRLLNTCIGSNTKYGDFMNFYMDKIKTISEIVNESGETKESVRASLLSEIKSLDKFRENSTIGEDAKENERHLRELMIYLNKEYTLKLDSKSIALLGEPSDNLIEGVPESTPEIKRNLSGQLKKPTKKNLKEHLLEVQELLSTLTEQDRAKYTATLLQWLSAPVEVNLETESKHDFCSQYLSTRLSKIIIGDDYKPSGLVEEAEEQDFFNLGNSYPKQADWQAALERLFRKEYVIRLIDSSVYKKTSVYRSIYQMAKFSFFCEKFFMQCRTEHNFQAMAGMIEKEQDYLQRLRNSSSINTVKDLLELLDLSIKILADFSSDITEQLKKIISTEKPLSLIPDSAKQQHIDPPEYIFKSPIKSCRELKSDLSNSVRGISRSRSGIFSPPTSGPKDKNILNFVKEISDNLLEHKQNVNLAFESLLSLWNELSRYCEYPSQHSSAIGEKLKIQILAIHDYLLSTDQNDDTSLQKLLYKEIDSGDSFSKLISFDLHLLNLNLKENINTLDFLKETLPIYIEKLQASQLYEVLKKRHCPDGLLMGW